MEELRYVSIADCLKATPKVEGNRRFVYLEASNESIDQQGEVVLAKALKESAEHFLKFGNLDLDHITMIGPKYGIADYAMYEIGKPLQVEVNGKRTFVKGEIYGGTGPAAQRANEFWSSLVDVTPPHTWFPSIGGSILRDEKKVSEDGKRRLIKAVRWVNIGFSKTPVNTEIGAVSTVPVGVFAKCWSADGFDLDLAKGLTAGYGTDSAALAGGGAMRQQSLDPKVHSYWDFREQVSGDLTSKRLKNPSAKALVQWAMQQYHLGADRASEWVEKYMADLSRDIKKRG